MKQAICGNCGCETARVGFDEPQGFHRAIELTCTKCSSRTLIVITTPRLDIGWPSHERDTDLGIFTIRLNQPPTPERKSP